MKQILWFSLCLFIGFYICEPIKDPDLWWHITAGKWMIAHLSLPTHELWNQFALGQPWRAYSWLAEIIFAGAWLWQGDHGLLILQMLLCFALVAGFSASFSLVAKNWFVGTLLGIFCAISTFSHLTLRPQTVVWILFAAIFPLLTDLEEQKKRGDPYSRKKLACLMLIFCIWANLHITTVLGIGAIAFWSFIGKSAKDLRQPIFLALIAFIGTLITPNFGAEWLTFASKTGHPFEYQAIAEFQAATIMQYVTGFFLTALTALFAVLIRKPKTIELSKLLMTLGFIIAGLAIIKFLPFAIICICATLALFWRRTGGLDVLTEGIQRLQYAYNAIPKEGFSFLLLCMVVVKSYGLWKKPLNDLLTLVKAFDFIEEKKLEQPLLIGFGQGGYAMFRQSDRAGNPLHTVPIDGRTNVVPHKVWDAFMAAHRGDNNWRDYFDLVKPSTVLWRSDSSLTSILLLDPEWCEVFRSGDKKDGYALYVKREFFLTKKDEFQSTDCGKSI